MRYAFILFTVLLSSSYFGIAQSVVNIDSVNFVKQRERVNNLLQERSKRFGDFDGSLRKKTGVFGIFKSKKDMQKSIDILRDIVITDNRLFLETKKLLDIKNNESDRNESMVIEYDKQISAYMHTIAKLQQENEKLRAQIHKLDSKQNINYLLTYVLAIVIMVLVFVIFRYFRPNNRKI